MMFHRLRMCLILLMVSIIGVGCGLAEYEERLQRTNEFYGYLDTINSNLASPAWQRPDWGMAMRVPLPFRNALPGPEVQTDEEGNEFYGPDFRQPDYMALILPGLVEAFQADFPTDSGESASGFLYIVSNHERFLTLEDGGPAPSEFHTDLEIALANSFGVSIPEGESSLPADNQRMREFHPARNHGHAQFNTPKDYIAIRVVPTEAVGDFPYQALVYERTVGDAQAAIVVVTPGPTSAQFRQRIDLALQTFEMTGDVPRSNSGGRIGSPGGGGGGSSAF